MSTLTIAGSKDLLFQPPKNKRVQSIDLLRGVVMIIMVLDHVRDYFHNDAFLFQPEDLSQTNVILFFTRWITHYCAPVFVFLSGIAAFLYGCNKTRKELSHYLFTRGLWLVFAEMFIVTLGWSFNPTYPFFNFQVIWAIGVSMIALSGLIYFPRRIILLTGILIVLGHNLLDVINAPHNPVWVILRQPGEFRVGHISLYFRYPVLPWIGIICIGYYFGSLYTPSFNQEIRKIILLSIGIGAIAVFFILRLSNYYGDPLPWSFEKKSAFTFLSVFNVTKYPPSLLYILVTLGPALIFLGLTEGPLNAFTRRISLFGRVPFFYYILHIYMVHFFAIIAVSITGHSWSDMILATRVNRVTGLIGYGFDLPVVYVVWITIVLLLYPCCKWFDQYKRANADKQWLCYV